MRFCPNDGAPLGPLTRTCALCGRKAGPVRRIHLKMVGHSQNILCLRVPTHPTGYRSSRGPNPRRTSDMLKVTCLVCRGLLSVATREVLKRRNP